MKKEEGTSGSSPAWLTIHCENRSDVLDALPRFAEVIDVGGCQVVVPVASIVKDLIDPCPEAPLRFARPASCAYPSRPWQSP